jgi:hypothetical protein
MSPTRNSDESAGSGATPGKQEIRARVDHESQRRARLGSPTIAGGVLFLLGGIIVSATLKPLPTVGVVQGLAPALRGEANPAVSPGAAEVRFVSSNAFGLLAGNVLQALAIVFILMVLLFLLAAVRFRRPETSPVARPLLLGGGAVMVFVSVVHPLAQVVNAHNFVGGHDFTAEAVNRALTKGAVLEATQYLGLLGGLVLAAGMVITVLGAARTGLVPRWMMYLGIFAALLAFTPFGLALGEAQQLVPAFWMVAMGILMMGRWPGGDPPAWAAGEARPWPSQAQVRTEREAARSAPDAGGDLIPEPAQPARSASSRRRRKRSAR